MKAPNNNSDFISWAAARIKAGDTKTSKRLGNLLFENGVLYSYSYHYPLLFKVKGELFVNNTGYSVTTAKHIGYAVMHARHRVALGAWNTYKKVAPTHNDVRLAIERELEKNTKKLKELSTRAWRQRQNIEERNAEILKSYQAVL